jgi:hypothetical protein
VARLLRFYPQRHTVVLYRASTFPGDAPVVQRLPLEAVCDAAIPSLAMLYVPSLPQREPDPRIVRWFRR